MQKEYEKKSFKSEINGNTTQRPTWLIYSFTSARIYFLTGRFVVRSQNQFSVVAKSEKEIF